MKDWRARRIARLGAALTFWTVRYGVLMLAAVLTSLTTLASLFGGVGLLYIPSIALFMWAASHTEPAIAP